ncbi:MAG TPA: TonB-dependent receptor [Chitinophagales bacterium]|nr:TonB-dependent receptor [Chitinophagales bacterium]
MRKTTLLILSVISGLFVNAQTGIIKGAIIEKGSGNPVELANVVIQGKALGAVSDSAGNFQISEVPAGIYNINISCLGYKAQTLFETEVTNSKPAILKIELEKEAQQLAAVEIKASQFYKEAESPVSVRTIGVNEIQRYPGGNRDISRVIQSLPGVGFSTAFRNDLIIRGGSPIENKFYLDDIEIPNINHFATQGGSGGPVGLINVDFIREVNFYTSAFPADRGNTLSSDMDIRLRDGRDDRFGITATLGITDAALSLESPLNKAKSATILASVRSSYYNWFFKLIQVPIFPNYNDAQFKIKWKINRKNDFEFLSLTACDIFRLNLNANSTEIQQYELRTIPVNNQWSYTNGIKYTHYFTDSYLQTVVSSSELVNQIYKYTDNNPALSKTFDYNSVESESKLRMEYIAHKNAWKYYVGGNYELAYYYNRSNFTGPYFVYNYLTRFFINKYGLFTSVSRTLANNRLSLSLGIRFDGNSYNKNMANIFYQTSPRFALSYSILDGFRWNFNTGYYHQMPAYTALGYRDSTNTLVNQNRLTYMHCLHVVTGFEYETKFNSRASVEGFFKQYFNTPFLLDDSLALANLGGDYGVVGNDPATSTAKGRAYGVEFLYEQKLYKGWYGIVAYTLFWSQFQNGAGKYVSASWDTRHIISLTAGKKFKHNWEIGLRYRIQGGKPYTPYNMAYSSLVAVYNANPQGVFDYSQLNTLRLPWFHQMDIRVTKKWYFKKLSLDLYLDIQNLYYSKTYDMPIFTYVQDANGNPVYTPNNQSYVTKLLTNTSQVIQPQLGIIINY